MALQVWCGRGCKLKVQLYIKRFLDVLISLVILVFVFPFMVLIAFLIKVTSKGPILYTQERLGENCRCFIIYKFRTMVENAEFVRDGLAVKSNDARITMLGRILRKTSIDEMPQLFNVIIGDLSLVGPRPALPAQLKYYNSHQRRRFEVRPGLTGLATVRGRCSIPWSRRIELDIEYIDKFSLLLDFKILFKTVYVVLFGKDTYYDSTDGPAFDLADPNDLPQAEQSRKKGD